MLIVCANVTMLMVIEGHMWRCANHSLPWCFVCAPMTDSLIVDNSLILLSLAVSSSVTTFKTPAAGVDDVDEQQQEAPLFSIVLSLRPTVVIGSFGFYCSHPGYVFVAQFVGITQRLDKSMVDSLWPVLEASWGSVWRWSCSAGLMMTNKWERVQTCCAFLISLTV